MNLPVHSPRALRLALLGVTALLAASAATAQITSDAATSQYQKDVQDCRAGASGQDLATCLKEATNARAEQRQRVPAPTAEQTLTNAMVRCAPLEGEDKKACQARVLGYGSSSGSVAGGGVLHTTETVVIPAAPAASKP
jgi:hypothetical protein